MNYFNKFTKTEIIDVINSDSYNSLSVKRILAIQLFENKTKDLYIRMDNILLQIEKCTNAYEILKLDKEYDKVHKQFDKLRTDLDIYLNSIEERK